MTVRTREEIAAHCEGIKKDDICGFKREVLLPCLMVEQVRPFLKPDTDLSRWTETPLDEAVIVGEMATYMTFAWGKVQDHRGISAGRSVEKMEAWCWLLGREDVLTAIAHAPYPQYGAPKLKVVCEAFGFPVPQDEPTQRMIQGKHCVPGCEEGCGQWTMK